MRLIKTLLKISVFCFSLSVMPLQAEPAIYDDSQLQLELPSVAVVSGGKVQGYFSVSLQVLADSNKNFTVLDNAYATALFGPVQSLPITKNRSATYDQDSKQLTIPAFSLKNAASGTPTSALNLRVLTTLDNAYILGL
ncbi:MAG: hypothetical protein KAH08_04840 [Methylococcales bacterium]|nr:hypothetical protein [Methylococcales bacterium]